MVSILLGRGMQLFARSEGTQRAARGVAVAVTALQQWRRELAAGTRTLLTFDHLWMAACREQADREFEAYVGLVRERVAKPRETPPDIGVGPVGTRPPISQRSRDFRTLPDFGGFRG